MPNRVEATASGSLAEEPVEMPSDWRRAKSREHPDGADDHRRYARPHHRQPTSVTRAGWNQARGGRGQLSATGVGWNQEHGVRKDSSLPVSARPYEARVSGNHQPACPRDGLAQDGRCVRRAIVASTRHASRGTARWG